MVKDMEWQLRGKCRDEDPEIMFPEPFDQAGVKESKQVCAGCPVQEMCLQWSLDHEEKFGTWGGVSETSRRRMIARGSRIAAKAA